MIPLWIAAGYLLGSIPVAWLVARWVTGQDLRRMGSGNRPLANQKALDGAAAHMKDERVVRRDLRIAFDAVQGE